jgi:hypothetical protein
MRTPPTGRALWARADPATLVVDCDKRLVGIIAPADLVTSAKGGPRNDGTIGRLPDGSHLEGA